MDKWPAPPEYYLTGGPWEPPPIPSEKERKWQSFSMALEPPFLTSSVKSSSSSLSSSSSSSSASTKSPSAMNNLRDVNINDFQDIVLELRQRYAELVWALSRMDSSKDEGYEKVTELINQQFVEAQSIVEAYHPKLVLLETLDQLKQQTQRREEKRIRLLEAIGRAHDDLSRAFNK